MTKKFGPAQNILGPVKGQGITYLFLLLFFHGILDNVKALYRRARAHVGAWNPEQAKNDFKKVAELDSG